MSKTKTTVHNHCAEAGQSNKVKTKSYFVFSTNLYMLKHSVSTQTRFHSCLSIHLFLFDSMAKHSGRAIHLSSFVLLFKIFVAALICVRM